MTAGSTLMARPKKSGPTPTPKPSASAEDRTTIINLKGSLIYDDWFERQHRKTHLSKAVIVRLALKLWAEENGHESPPEI